MSCGVSLFFSYENLIDAILYALYRSISKFMLTASGKLFNLFSHLPKWEENTKSVFPSRRG